MAAGGESRWEYLSGLIWAIRDGATLPAETLLVILPKHIVAGEVEEVWREPIVLRPLGLQNADAKII